MPNPHSPFYNSEAYSKWDKISAAARYEQVAHKLTPDEKTAVLSTIVSFSGTSPEKVSFGDCFRWWMLVGQTGDFLMDNTQRWKLKSGQTDFALKIFEDAQSSRKLSYSFSTPVEKVEQSSQAVKVTVKGGQTFAARFMVATVPLNTLNDIVFDPPLARSKQLAASEGQVNYCVKTHVEVEGTDYRTWSAATFPGPLTGVFGDGITPSGNTHLVSFAANDSFTGSDKGFPEIKAAYQTLKPFNIKRMVSWTCALLPIFAALVLTHSLISSTIHGLLINMPKELGVCLVQVSLLGSYTICKRLRDGYILPTLTGRMVGAATLMVQLNRPSVQVRASPQRC